MYTSEYLAIIIQLYKKRYGDINVHASVSTYFVFLLVYVSVYSCVYSAAVFLIEIYTFTNMAIRRDASTRLEKENQDTRMNGKIYVYNIYIIYIYHMHIEKGVFIYTSYKERSIGSTGNVPPSRDPFF